MKKKDSDKETEEDFLASAIRHFLLSLRCLECGWRWDEHDLGGCDALKRDL